MRTTRPGSRSQSPRWRVSEGDTGRYTIVLDTEPTADVTVEIQVPEDTDIAVAPLMLTFTADNWNTPQTVAVTAAQDDDAVTDDPVTITHIVSGGDYEGCRRQRDVEVTITEDDTAGVTISTDVLEVSEGSSQSYTVVLDTEPAADVTVVVADAGRRGSSGVSSNVDFHGRQLEYTTDSRGNRRSRRRRHRRRSSDADARRQWRRLRGRDGGRCRSFDYRRRHTRSHGVGDGIDHTRRRFPELHGGAGYRASGRRDGRGGSAGGR